MKKHNKHIPAAAKVNLLRQICNFIPDFLVPKLARATGVQDNIIQLRSLRATRSDIKGLVKASQIVLKVLPAALIRKECRKAQDIQ